MYFTTIILKVPSVFCPQGPPLSLQDSMALATALEAQLQLREVAGIPLQASTVDNWNQIQNFEAKPDDLLICTYPKSGDCGTRGTIRLQPVESARAAHIS